MKMLAVAGRTQRWVAVRVHLPIPLVNKIVNGRRFPTEEQVLRIAARAVCTEEELSLLAEIDTVAYDTMTDTGVDALIGRIRSLKLPAAMIAAEASIGLPTVQAFLAKTLKISDEEVVRLFLVVVVRDDRRRIINEIIESAGDFVLGPVGTRDACDAPCCRRP